MTWETTSSQWMQKVDKLETENVALKSRALELQGKVYELESENILLMQRAGHLVHLHLCDQEGLSDITPEQYEKAVDELGKLLDPVEDIK